MPGTSGVHQTQFTRFVDAQQFQTEVSFLFFDEDPYRPEAFMDNSGAQLFVIYDCICNGVYIQEVLTHLIKCDVTLFFIVLSLCL